MTTQSPIAGRMRPFLLTIAVAGVAVALACGSENRAASPAAVASQPPVAATRAASGAPASQSTAQAGARPLQGPAFGGSQAADANLLTGTIASASADSVTVNTQRGPLRVTVDANTRVTRTVEIKLGDLKIGENVTITGPRAEDGSITAQAVTASERRDLFVRRSGDPAGPGGTAGTSSPGGFSQRFGGPADGVGGGPGTPPAGGIQRFGQAGPGGQGQGAQGGGPRLTEQQADELVQQAVASGRITQDQAAAFRDRLLGRGAPDGGPDSGSGFRQFTRMPGTVAAVEAGALTLSADGGQVKVNIGGDTRILRVETVAPADLAVGTNVSVAAERGADGVVRATLISVGSDLQPAGF
ncbi:MAG: hypothetical protein HY682_12415 [Chloroflexi bacterium]|nr:hypothetical protein [Chloroflexota bacterium]